MFFLLKIPSVCERLKNLQRGLFFLGLMLIFFGLFPAFANAATLYIDPASGSIPLDSTFSVMVRTNTQGEAVNSAEAAISYTTNTLELVKVSSGSNFPLQTPGSPGKTSGGAFFSGGVPTPGYTGSGGIVGIMTFQAKALGTAKVSVVSGKVLLNNGQGTDVLNSMLTANYTIVPAPLAGGSVAVASESHPDQNVWYQKREVVLSWDRPKGVYGYSFVFDQSPSAVLDDILDTTITTNRTYANVADGIWYFRIKGRNKSSPQYGAVTSFIARVDAVPPEPFIIGVEGRQIAEGQPLNIQNNSARIIFSAIDKLSGIDHYDIYLDGQLLKSELNAFYSLQNLSIGSHAIKVMAFDKAKNFRDAALILNVAPQEISSIVSTVTFPKLYLWIFLVMLAIINGLIWILFFYRRKLWEAKYVIQKLEHELKQEESQHLKIKRK